MDNQIDIAAPEAPVSQLQPIDISEDPSSSTPVGEDVAASRAQKIRIGNPDFPMSIHDTARHIMSGREEDIRAQLAAAKDTKSLSDRQQKITNLVSTGALTPDKVAAIQNYAKPIVPSDPKTVVETSYANQVVNTVLEAGKDNPDSFINDAQITMPEKVNEALTAGVGLEAKKQYIRTQLENLEAERKQQGWVGFGFEMAKYMIPGYNELNLRGLQGNYEGFLGKNLNSTRADLFSKPFDEFTTRVDAITKHLKDEGLLGGNSMLASTFLSAMNDQSAMEMLINNSFSALDFYGAAAKPAIILAGRTALKESALFNNVKKAVVDAIKTKPEEPVSTATLNENVGNIKAAGAEKASVVLNNAANNTGNAVVDSLSTLHSIFDINVTNIQGNPGNFSREAVARVVERENEFRTSLVDKLQNSVQVERLPGVFANPKTVAEWLEKEKNNYPGMDNSILNMGLRYDPIDKAKYVDYYIGKNGTELWGSEPAARAFINQHFLNKIATVEQIEGPGAPKFAKVSKKIGIGDEVTWESPLIPGIKTPEKIVSISTDGKYANLESGVSGISIKELTKESTTPQAVVGQKGVGFYVRVTKPLDEEQSVLRAGLVGTADQNTPSRNMLNAFGGWLGSKRTPEETLAKLQNDNRHAVAYGPSVFLETLHNTTKELEGLKRWAIPGLSKSQKWKDWERVISDVMNVPDPVTGALGRDKMFNSPGELQSMYQRILGRLPDEQELHAAFSYKRAMEGRNLLDNLEIRSQKLRLGSQTHTVYTLDKSRETRTTIPTKGFTVDGKRINYIPRDGETVLIMGEHLGEEQAITTHNIRGSLEERLTKELESGESQMIELAVPGELPLYWMSDETKRIRPAYVIAKNVKSEPLSWDQIKSVRRPDYDYAHYVAQPIMTHDPVSKFSHYEGDRHIAAFNIRAMGRDVAKKLDTIRVFLKKEDIQGAKDFHSTSGLPQDFNDIRNWFEPGITSEGLPIPARLSKDEEIQLVSRTGDSQSTYKTLLNKYGDNLRDGTKETYIKLLNDRRDPHELFTFNDSGTKGKPIYNITPVQYLSPVQSLNRGLNKAINGRFLSDYKISAIEHWIQEAKDYLAPTDTSLRSAPQYHFHNPVWKAETPPEIKTNLTTSQMQIKQLLGVQDENSAWLHSVAQNLSDSLYANVGLKRGVIYPLHEMPILRDPAGFIRSAVFHPIIGLFSPAQIVKQFSSITNAYSIAGPRYATAGTQGLTLHMWARLSQNPDTLKALDKLATLGLPGMSRYRAGEWLEAHDALNNTGFGHVGNEYAALDRAMNNNFVEGAGKAFLNVGTWPFRTGEAGTRINAWYTAYREFRDQNPTGPLDVKAVLSRADLLNLNMSRASNSTVHQGWKSIPLQFQTYPLRMAELWTGKRLTQEERTRMFGVNALLFGMPSALNLGGVPLGPGLQQKSMSETDNQEGTPQSIAMQGLPHYLMWQMTGKGYDAASAYGPSGVMPDLLWSDKHFWEVLGGAPYNIISQSIAGFSGLTKSMVAYMRDDEQRHPFKADDFIEPFRALSAVDKAYQVSMAMAYGKWFSKKENYITDVDTKNAIFSTLSGMQFNEVSDMNTMTKIRATEKNLATDAEATAIKEFRRGLMAGDKNPSQASDYFDRAFTSLKLANYPQEKYAEFMATAMKDYESTARRIAEEFYTKDVPENRKGVARDAMLKLLDQQGNK